MISLCMCVSAPNWMDNGRMPGLDIYSLIALIIMIGIIYGWHSCAYDMQYVCVCVFVNRNVHYALLSFKELGWLCTATASAFVFSQQNDVIVFIEMMSTSHVLTLNMKYSM